MQNLQFQYIDHLWWLLLIPVLVLVYILYLWWVSRKKKELGDERLVQLQLMGEIKARRTTRFILPILALFFLILGYGNLRSPSGMERSARKGVDVIVALDVSRSMLATDVSPDRLSRGKIFIRSLMDELNGDRLALVLFAGRSYLQVPLTVDYNATRLSLDAVSPASVPTQGTAIASAMALARKSFSQKERKYKTLIIISDGETHDNGALDEAKAAAEEGIIIYTIGVGQPEGVALTNHESGEPILDIDGRQVISKLNEPLMQKIAQATGGFYYSLYNPQQLAQSLSNAIASMEQKNFGAALFTDYKSYYAYFLAVALALLLIDALVPGARRKQKKRGAEQG